MKKQRLTREQSREQTHRRLLDAGKEIFVKKGFVGASIESIAEAAGYTRGAFYSNFSSKSELFLELLRRDHEAIQAGLTSAFEGEASTEMTAHELLFRNGPSRESENSLLWIEARLLAARDARFRECFNAFLRERSRS
ncbi:TetR/AcrR family transcriptional regulator [Trinickia terrae]|uniref:TetR/AcrR family transcriptional regulator n=1 Tax=Trinickia terrae TaxID=2571161 RepID=A0A4U1I3I5_9BURK|nr:TetR/AcrR family transcriptional regulator [Trinickia terrae]